MRIHVSLQVAEMVDLLNSVELCKSCIVSSKQASILLPTQKNTIILSRNLGLCTLYSWIKIQVVHVNTMIIKRERKDARFDGIFDFLIIFQGKDTLICDFSPSFVKQLLDVLSSLRNYPFSILDGGFFFKTFFSFLSTWTEF